MDRQIIDVDNGGALVDKTLVVKKAID